MVSAYALPQLLEKQFPRLRSPACKNRTPEKTGLLRSE
jgi:hypothetical protein